MITHLMLTTWGGTQAGGGKSQCAPLTSIRFMTPTSMAHGTYLYENIILSVYTNIDLLCTCIIVLESLVTLKCLFFCFFWMPIESKQHRSQIFHVWVLLLK